jgi:MYXO-CTERM domain-containing protein
MTITFTHRLFTTSLATATLLFAGAASAEECGPLDCGEGFDCNIWDPGDGSEVSYSCERAACESDDECGDIMICGTYEVDCEQLARDCAGGGCAPDIAETCEPEFKQCAATWDLLCEEAADCGEGFDCVPVENCDCVEVDEDGKCTDCYATDIAQCIQQVIDCTADSDCATHWLCTDGVCGPPPELYGQFSGPAILDIATTSEPNAEDTSSGASGVLGDEEAVEETTEDTPDVAEDSDDTEVIDDEGKGPGRGEVEMMGSDDPQSSGGGCSVTAGSNGGPGSLLAALGLALGALFVGRRRRAV